MGEQTCLAMNRISIKNLADSDESGEINMMLGLFYNKELSSNPVFTTEYHVITDEDRKDGLFISCQNIVVPRNLSELKYSEQYTVDFSKHVTLKPISESVFVLE